MPEAMYNIETEPSYMDLHYTYVGHKAIIMDPHSGKRWP